MQKLMVLWCNVIASKFLIGSGLVGDEDFALRNATGFTQGINNDSTVRNGSFARTYIDRKACKPHLTPGVVVECSCYTNATVAQPIMPVWLPSTDVAIRTGRNDSNVAVLLGHVKVDEIKDYLCYPVDQFLNTIMGPPTVYRVQGVPDKLQKQTKRNRNKLYIGLGVTLLTLFLFAVCVIYYAWKVEKVCKFPITESEKLVTSQSDIQIEMTTYSTNGSGRPRKKYEDPLRAMQLLEYLGHRKIYDKKDDDDDEDSEGNTKILHRRFVGDDSLYQ